jgi:hypothetical protein
MKYEKDRSEHNVENPKNGFTTMSVEFVWFVQVMSLRHHLLLSIMAGSFVFLG